MWSWGEISNIYFPNKKILWKNSFYESSNFHLTRKNLLESLSRPRYWNSQKMQGVRPKTTCAGLDLSIIVTARSLFAVKIKNPAFLLAVEVHWHRSRDSNCYGIRRRRGGPCGSATSMAPVQMGNRHYCEEHDCSQGKLHCSNHLGRTNSYFNKINK